MPLKCYTTVVPANQSIAEIQQMLVTRGAVGLMLEYDPTGNGRIANLTFALALDGRKIGFRLPLRRSEVGKILANDPKLEGRYRNRARTDDDYVYRVAWRVVREWVDAQMAMVDLRMVQVQEVFLPYAVGQSGETLYETMVKDPGRLLGPGV